MQARQLSGPMIRAERDWGSRRRNGEKRDLLLSIKYGMPTTKANPTTAIRIIGFFKRSNGETVAHELAIIHQPRLQPSHSSFYSHSNHSSISHPHAKKKTQSNSHPALAS